MEGLKSLLADLTKVEGINSAVVVGRDGFVIESSDAKNVVDVEAIGAVISTGTGASEMMGKELAIGELQQSMVEFKNGIVLTSLLGREAVLAVLADLSANLGNIRYQVKKRAPEIQRAL
jgi:predicted regulator of Ras-like GTPase activity (Roadblock/LC7/MglB family)